MFNYITNAVIVFLAWLTLFFSSEPDWVSMASALGTIGVALFSMLYQFFRGQRTVEVDPSDWQGSANGGFYFESKRKYSNPTMCATYAVREDGAREEVMCGVCMIRGGVRIESNSAIKLVLEIS